MSDLTPLKVMKLLDQGHELCGICGKDITGKPDCVHNETDISYSSADDSLRQDKHRLKADRTMRIGEEFLALYPDHIYNLPCVDNFVLTQQRTWSYHE